MFGDLAPKYWAKGLSVVPLAPRTKQPVMNDWNKFASALPTKEQQDYMVSKWPSGNIGLALGKQSGIVIIDIDTSDPRIMDAIRGVLPESPWERFGQKGIGLAYKYNGEAIHRIRGQIGGEDCTIVEILSQGSQVVLPPSIHPDTQKPYVANCELLDVLDKLVKLPSDIEDRIRTAVGQIVPITSRQNAKKFNSASYISSGARDNQMNRHAGYLARCVLKGDQTLKQAITDMLSWSELRVENVVGDPLDVTKGQNQIVQYLLGDVSNKGKILPPGWDEDLTEEDKIRLGCTVEAKDEEWTVDQLMAYIMDIYNNYPKVSPERVNCMEYVLTKLSKSTALNSLDIDRVLVALKADTGLTVASMKKHIREKQAGPIQGVSHTEVALEVIKEIERKRGKIAYYSGKLWCWNGSNWEDLQDQVIREHIQINFGHLDIAKRGGDHSQITGVIKDQVPQRLTVDSQLIHGVNFANGFLNSQLELVPHSPDFGMTYTLPFSYRPDLAGKCPKFFSFLDYSWGRDGDFDLKKIALQEAMSATLFGVMPSFAKCLLLYGPGGSGKSVLMKIVSAMVPPEGRCAISPEDWAEKFVLANFAGKILNVAGELHETKKIEGKMFKGVISGEEITTRDVREKSFVLKPIAAHWFCSNHLPKSSDSSNGFNRRWLMLEFSRVVPQTEIIIDYDQEIVSEEIEAIVAWALTSFEGLINRGSFTTPTSHTNLVKEMSLQNSDVRQWSEARTIKNGSASLDELYKDYFGYCMSVLQQRARGPKSFNIELEQLLLEQGLLEKEVGTTSINYRGVSLKPRR